MNTTVFEHIYESALLLREAKTFDSAGSIILAIKDGTMVKLLNGKKNLPEWLKHDIDENNNNIEEIRSCFNRVLNLASENINNGINETIYLLIRKSTSLDVMKQIIERSSDALIAYSSAIKTQWIKNLDIAKRVESEPYNEELWRDFEKDVMEIKSQRQAKKHKAISTVNNLYDTLYEDQTWGLYRPKNQAGDSELASHIKPFLCQGKTYTKTRWCTAADEAYYKNYAQNGNGYYVIKYFVDGEYTEAWQIAFYEDDSVEFMDKTDSRNYNFLIHNAPDTLLEKIVCDNQLNNNLTLKDFKYSGEEDLDLFFSIVSKDLWEEYLTSEEEDASLNNFKEQWEFPMLKNKGMISKDVTDRDFERYGTECITYSNLLKRYNLQASNLPIEEYTGHRHSAWDRYISLIQSGEILKSITIEEFEDVNEADAKEFSRIIKTVDGFEESNLFTLYDFAHMGKKSKDDLYKFIDYKNNGKLLGISYTDYKAAYNDTMPAEDSFAYLQAVADGKCPKMPKNYFGPQVYKNCKNKEALALMAKDIKDGTLPADTTPNLYEYYDRNDVLEFFDLAQKGAFDSTATLKQFVEYGAQNLNDINVLKHQKRLWPTFDIEECFRLGADKILAISKEMYNKNYPATATLDDYFTYGETLLVYEEYKKEFPDAYFTESLDNFLEAYNEDRFDEFIRTLRNPRLSWYQSYAYEYWEETIDDQY